MCVCVCGIPELYTTIPEFEYNILTLIQFFMSHISRYMDQQRKSILQLLRRRAEFVTIGGVLTNGEWLFK